MSAATVAGVVQRLGLEPLPGEGGLFRQTYIDQHSSAIYYLLANGDFSAMHALDGVEVYHWYAGSPLSLLLLQPDGAVAQPVLGPDLSAGQRPQCVVPVGAWQGSSSLGAWTLVGTTMAPPYSQAGFRLGDRGALSREYPTAAARIVELTRPAR
ncbi:MAG: cupin domain-containing protein [Bifidobacteriaceae bacterium]|nr:cupin domain-containing protein [Bifidobacteriaceae bacterium]